MAAEVSAVFNAANLRHGGGVQVASSLFTELAGGGLDAEFPWLAEARFIASDEVAANLDEALLADPRLLRHAAGRTGARPQLDLAADAVWFDVFGGAVQRKVPVPRLAGFADVTAIYPHPFARGLGRLKLALRSALSRASFRRADHLVVETAAVRDRLGAHGFDRDRIDVVANTQHPVFDAPVAEVEVERWAARLDAAGVTGPRLLFVSRAYPHKNHGFFAEVAAAAEARGGERPTLVVTLSEEEFAGLDEATRAVSVNLGPLRVQELPALYRAVDAVFFPSLLECFSATPLEGIRSGTPVVAIERDYVTAVVGERAFYFTEGDAAGAADAIDRALAAQGGDVLAEWAQWAATRGGSTQRARAYCLIMDALRPVEHGSTALPKSRRR